MITIKINIDFVVYLKLTSENKKTIKEIKNITIDIINQIFSKLSG
jgi:hypothetical protein